MNQDCFLVCKYRFKKRKGYFLNFQLGVVKNTLGQSKFEILKLAVSQEEQGQSAWFFVCWDRLKEKKKLIWKVLI